MTIKGFISNNGKLEKLERGELTLKKSKKRAMKPIRAKGVADARKQMAARLGKPYSQQPGRKAGKGTGKIVEPKTERLLGENKKTVNKIKDEFLRQGLSLESIPDGVIENLASHLRFTSDDDIKDMVKDYIAHTGESKVAEKAPFPETGGKLDLSKVSDVEMEGIDRHDYPDFSDAFIASASYAGREMTEDELDTLNNDSQFVYEQIPDDIMASDDMEKSRLGRDESYE